MAKDNLIKQLMKERDKLDTLLFEAFDEHFPKGGQLRGEAMVVMSLAQMLGRREQEIIEQINFNSQAELNNSKDLD